MPSWEEREFFGLPGPFLMAGGFSPLRTSRFIRLILFLGFTKRRGEFVADIIFRCSPFTSWPFLAVGDSLVPVFRDFYLADGVFRGMALPSFP